MPSIMDALAGMRLLLAGDDRAAVGALRSAVGAAGAVAAACTGDPADVVAVVAADPPAAVIAIGGNAASLRERLDPLELEMGPEVVAIEDLVDAGRAFDGVAAARLRAIVERRALRARQTELEAVVAAQAVARRRHDEVAALDTLRRLALAAEYRDDNTHEHTQRVGELAARLARHLGHEDRTVWLIREVAPLHDLGKIAIPDTVLLKPGRLTREEFEVVKTHAVLGARVLAGG
jgi:HD-GYP domain-containing protein (c-di-GMP phosphodiesterase class II)